MGVNFTLFPNHSQETFRPTRGNLSCHCCPELCPWAGPISPPWGPEVQCLILNVHTFRQQVFWGPGQDEAAVGPGLRWALGGARGLLPDSCCGCGGRLTTSSTLYTSPHDLVTLVPPVRTPWILDLRVTITQDGLRSTNYNPPSASITIF